MKRHCIFHAGCPDGFGAAWSVWRAWGDDARYVPRGHEDAFEADAFAGDLVAIVDISLSNTRLRALSDVAGRIVVLDHHVTARDALAADPTLQAELESAGHLVHFDLSHSGAVLAWRHFHPDEPVPELLAYVEDQDLWAWKLPSSEEVNAAIGSYPREFRAWEELAGRAVESLVQEGLPIVRSNRLEIERALHAAHPVAIGTRRIEAVNALHNRAAIGHELAKRARYGSPWGLVYRMTGSRVDCSIYSTGDFDVSEVAAGYGGGGHRNAAGFGVGLDRWLRDFV